jgi:hypothetical protein
LRKSSNLQGSSYYGINGGFFDFNSNRNINNVAINDGNVVETTPDSPNRSGIDNSFCGRGVCYYNARSGLVGIEMGIQNMNNSSLSGLIRIAGAWAQGGRGLSLANSNWRNLETAHPFTEKWEYTASGMSAMVVNSSTKDVYLIVYNGSNISPATFRIAIQTYFGIQDTAGGSSNYKGILLDGSGSSQMKAKNSSGTVVNVTGDSRALVQIITLKTP